MTTRSDCKPGRVRSGTVRLKLREPDSFTAPGGKSAGTPPMSTAFRLPAKKSLSCTWTFWPGMTGREPMLTVPSSSRIWTGVSSSSSSTTEEALFRPSTALTRLQLTTGSGSVAESGWACIVSQPLPRPGAKGGLLTVKVQVAMSLPSTSTRHRSISPVSRRPLPLPSLQKVKVVSFLKPRPMATISSPRRAISSLNSTCRATSRPGRKPPSGGSPSSAGLSPKAWRTPGLGWAAASGVASLVVWIIQSKLPPSVGLVRPACWVMVTVTCAPAAMFCAPGAPGSKSPK